MNIVLYKDTLYNTKSLYDEVNSYDFLEGFVLAATITNDDKIIVYNLAYNISSYIENLQTENYNDLKSNSFYEMEDFLKAFKDYKGKIIINLIGAPNVVGKPNKNYTFVLNLKKIISNYKDLDLYICSTYDDIITYIDKDLSDVKKGMFVYEGNLNYYDVDFYLMPSRMLDTKVVVQQLKKDKEMMFMLESSEDIISVVDKFKRTVHLFEGMDKKSCSKQLFIVTNSPRVINIVLNCKKD